MSASKFQQLSDAFLKISQGFAEVASLMNTNLEPVELRSEVLSTDEAMESTEAASNSHVSSLVAQPPAKKVKKERDPNLPKKPLNNYFLFQRDFRARYKESHPTATSAELTKIMNETWEKMSEEDAKYYDNLAKEHYAAYMKALEEYKKKGQEGSEGVSELVSEGVNEGTSEGVNEGTSEPSEHSEPSELVNTPTIPTTNNTPANTIPIQADINMTSSDAEAPKKKKKKNKEKREKHAE